MLVHWLRLYTMRSDEHWKKHEVGIAIPGYIFIVVNLVQYENASSPIVSQLDMSLLASFLQPQNALYPIDTHL